MVTHASVAARDEANIAVDELITHIAEKLKEKISDKGINTLATANSPEGQVMSQLTRLLAAREGAKEAK